MTIKSVGITGLLCVFGEDVSEKTASLAAQMDHAVRMCGIRGVTGTVPSYTSLLITYDPDRISYPVLKHKVRSLASSLKDDGAVAGGTTFEIPVCYGGIYGPDIEHVAEHTGLTVDEVIRLHSEPLYRVYMLGFLPGFPYLGGMNEKLTTPRLKVPRKSIPAGSVGIGNAQTGVYPMESPGGWQLIGRTPLVLFDPDKPLPYHAGDFVRFVPIDAAEFERIHGEGMR